MRKTKVLALAALSASAVLLSGCFGSPKTETVAWEASGATAQSGASLSGTAAVTAQGFVAYVSEAAGTVTKRPSAGGRARPVVPGSTALAAGEILSTGEDGSASVTFADGTTVRLAASSRIVFSAISAGSADATLETGALWARVLKPLGDGTLYTFRTSDLSAGVRGTAVYLASDASGSQVEVHDSFSENPSESGAVVDVPSAGAGSGQEIHLAPRQRLTVLRAQPLRTRAAGTGALAQTGSLVREEPLDKAAAMADDFKRSSTQKDLVLMANLIRERPLAPAQRRKIEGELAVSMPSDARQVLALIRERALVAMPGAGSGAAVLSPEESARRLAADSGAMMDRVERDLAIGQLRDRFNRDARQNLSGGRAGRDDRIVEDKRALDEAVGKILNPNTGSGQLRRELPSALPPMPGDAPHQDDGSLRDAVRDFLPDRKPLPTSPAFRIPETPARDGSGDALTGAKAPEKTEPLRKPDAKAPVNKPRTPAPSLTPSGEAVPVSSGEPLPR